MELVSVQTSQQQKSDKRDLLRLEIISFVRGEKKLVEKEPADKGPRKNERFMAQCQCQTCD
jgi:hypothetical protein